MNNPQIELAQMQDESGANAFSQSPAKDLEKSANTSASQELAFLVAFSQPFDQENPKDWPLRKKWLVTTVLSSTGFNRIMVSTIMAPALTTIRHEFHQTSIESTMSLSVYLLATAFGPLFIGPLSEIYGRLPVFHASALFFLIWNLICGFSKGTGLLIASRLFAGLGASSIYALGAGVLGDLWRPEERGRSLGIYMLIPLLGVVVGPIIGGYITEYTTWRWMFWSTSILQAAMMVLSISTYHESYAPLILKRRAQQLRKSTGNSQYYTAAEKLEAGRTVMSVMRKSLTRPFRLLAFHPIIQIMSLLSAFSYGITYFLISTFSTLWITQYHESISTSGLHYIAYALGEIAGAEIGGPVMDYSFRRLKERANDDQAVPEYRMPLVIPVIIIAAIGMFVYGWTAHFQVFWLAVDIGVVILGFGWQIAGQCVQAYVIDSYPDHTSSATAATQFLRSLTAFAFPLFAPKLYDSLGYGWGNSTLAFVTLGIGIPAPLLVWRYGARLRAKAKSSY